MFHSRLLTEFKLIHYTEYVPLKINLTGTNYCKWSSLVFPHISVREVSERWLQFGPKSSSLCRGSVFQRETGSNARQRQRHGLAWQQHKDRCSFYCAEGQLGAMPNWQVVGGINEAGSPRGVCMAEMGVEQLIQTQIWTSPHTHTLPIPPPTSICRVGPQRTPLT